MSSDNLISEEALFTALCWNFSNKKPSSGSFLGIVKNCNPLKTYHVEITPDKIHASIFSSLKKPFSLFSLFSFIDTPTSIVEARWIRNPHGCYLEYWKKNGKIQADLGGEAILTFQKAKDFSVYTETFDSDD